MTCLAKEFGGEWCVGKCRDPKDCSATPMTPPTKAMLELADRIEAHLRPQIRREGIMSEAKPMTFANYEWRMRYFWPSVLSFLAGGNLVISFIYSSVLNALIASLLIGLTIWIIVEDQLEQPRQNQ